MKEDRGRRAHLPLGSSATAEEPFTCAGMECKLFRFGYSTIRTCDSLWWMRTSASPAKLKTALVAVRDDLFQTYVDIPSIEKMGWETNFGVNLLVPLLLRRVALSTINEEA